MSSARKLLYPFSLLYGGITGLRNQLFDRKVLPSRSFDVPVICVGNLSVGGTGKSPMVEYLVRLLKEKYRVATLSRGYKRSTTGFLLLGGHESAAETGDEPLQFKRKFPEVMVAVDEKRVRGIASLLGQPRPPEVILLDDAFQHRQVKAGLNILLTPYNSLYSDDQVLPAGNLREPRSGADRADILVVTKCPAHLTISEKDLIRRKLRPEPGQELYFSTIVYSNAVRRQQSSFPLDDLKAKPFTLVTGIANPRPFMEFLLQRGLKFDQQVFPDHHNFSQKEIAAISSSELVLTTEKDFVRLRGRVPADKLCYLPIETALLEDREQFERHILDYVQKK